MSRNKLNLKELGEILIALVRAKAGDFSGLASKMKKWLPTIIILLISLFLVIIIVVLSPLIAAVSFFSSLFGGGPDANITGSERIQMEVLNEALSYKENWLAVLMAAQCKKSPGGGWDMPGAYRAFTGGTMEAWLGGEAAYEQYQSNLSWLKSMIGSYAGPADSDLTLPPEVERVSWYTDPVTGARRLVGEQESDTWTEVWSYEEVEDVADFEFDASASPKTLKLIRNQWKICSWFPVWRGANAVFKNDFDEIRRYDGKSSSHGGIDVFVPRGTKLVAIEDCEVEKIGWDGIDGWFIELRSTDGLRLYRYAHLEDYAGRLQVYKGMSGKVHKSVGSVKSGEVVGYAGSSGSYSRALPPGTDSGEQPHLCFKLWVVDEGWFKDEEVSMNPFFTLKLLELNQKSDE